MFKKLFYHSIPLCLLPLVILSCNKDSIPPHQEEPVKPTELTVEWENPDTTNFVSLDKVKEFANQHILRTKGDVNIEVKIETYGKIADTPLLYVVNYGKSDGWQILSSDARTPAVIAEGDNGYFSLEEGSPAVRVWMDMMAGSIASVRKAKDNELSISEEDIFVNKNRWTKEKQKVLPRPIDDEDGYWVKELVSEETEIYDIVEHMTPHWDQMNPYNAYIPLKSDGSLNRAPAGCVPVAAAEVLYYLHSQWNVPNTMVSQGVCVGDINNYSRSFTNPNTEVWAEMSNSYNGSSANAEALMIAYVGSIIGTNFHNEYSWTLPKKIRTELFPIYGITCSHGDYNASAVKQNLRNHLPVIVTATNLLIPVDFDIHCFVIDGYKMAHTKRTYYNYWVSGFNPNPRSAQPKPNYKPLLHEPYYSYSYGDLGMTGIKINWGWWTQWSSHPVNDGWYSLASDWTVTCNSETYSYNHNVSMIYNLTKPQ